jgi:hypothetical protein
MPDKPDKPAASGPDAPKAAKAAGADQVQAKMQADIDKGYHGEDDDPLKPDGYTLLGSVARAEKPSV